MFEQWKEQELAEIKERFGKARLLTIGLMALVGFNMLGGVVMLLDGGGAMEAVVLFPGTTGEALCFVAGGGVSLFPPAGEEPGGEDQGYPPGHIGQGYLHRGEIPYEDLL